MIFFLFPWPFSHVPGEVWICTAFADANSFSPAESYIDCQPQFRKVLNLLSPFA